MNTLAEEGEGERDLTQWRAELWADWKRACHQREVPQSGLNMLERRQKHLLEVHPSLCMLDRFEKPRRTVLRRLEVVMSPGGQTLSQDQWTQRD